MRTSSLDVRSRSLALLASSLRALLLAVLGYKTVYELATPSRARPPSRSTTCSRYVVG
jgi:hypothetical protein